jgi:hypothetical protein
LCACIGARVVAEHDRSTKIYVAAKTGTGHVWCPQA